MKTELKESNADQNQSIFLSTDPRCCPFCDMITEKCWLKVGKLIWGHTSALSSSILCYLCMMQDHSCTVKIGSRMKRYIDCKLAKHIINTKVLAFFTRARQLNEAAVFQCIQVFKTSSHFTPYHFSLLQVLDLVLIPKITQKPKHLFSHWNQLTVSRPGAKGVTEFEHHIFQLVTYVPC